MLLIIVVARPKKWMPIKMLGGNILVDEEIIAAAVVVGDP
jgi:hypothetical protein